jgi:hypothetical protein
MHPNKDSPVKTQMVVVVLDGAINRQYHDFNMERKKTGKRDAFITRKANYNQLPSVAVGHATWLHPSKGMKHIQ